MSEEEVVNDDVDLEALQANIDETLIDEDDTEQHFDAEVDAGQETGEEVEEFNLDEALDSDAPIVLEGKITEEQAIEKAKERGWREDGQDKYGHQISAIEFLERTPLFHKMDLMRGDVQELQRQNKKILEQNKQIAQKAIDDAKKKDEELREAKAKLLSEEVLDKDDITRLKDIDRQIEDNVVNPDEPSEEEQKEMVAKYEKAKTTFVDENSEWYRNDYKMTEYADKVGVDFATAHFDEHGYLPEPEVTFQHTLDKVKEKYPDMGKPPEQTRTTRVASTRNRTVANKIVAKKTLDDLPEDMRPVARMVMESAGLSEDEYMKQYESN